MTIRLKIFLFLYIILILFISCDAPRNNPVDPQNENNKLSQLSGIVQTISIPHTPLEDAAIFWKQSNSLVFSDNQGYFEIPNVTNENGTLIIEKEGYQSDTLNIIWSSNKNLIVESSLNYLPVVDSISFYSIVENTYSAANRYKLESSLKIYDADNDVDSVFMINPALNFVGTMNYNTLSKEYERVFSLRELGIESANEIIGKDFQIIVKDLAEHSFNLGKTNVKRVINEFVQIQTPIGKDTVSVPFPLNWERLLPGFEFTYQAQIYTDDIDKELMWQKFIPSDAITFDMETPLTVGNYFWVIWCIDEFGNKSRSKQASFIIE